RPPDGSHVDRIADLTVHESEGGLLHDAAEASRPDHLGRTPRVAEGDARDGQPPSSERDLRSLPPARGGACPREDRRDGGSERRARRRLKDDAGLSHIDARGPAAPSGRTAESPAARDVTLPL